VIQNLYIKILEYHFIKYLNLRVNTLSEDQEIKYKRQKIMDLLKELEQKTELEASAVVTKEGIRLACSVSAEMDADMFSAAAAAMVNLGSMTIRRLKQGDLKEVIIKGDEGYTIVTEADANTMLVAAGRQSFRLGYYVGVLKNYARNIANILSTIKKPVEEIVEVIAEEEAASTSTSESKEEPVARETFEISESEEQKAATVEQIQPKKVESPSLVKRDDQLTKEEKTALESERKAILEALKALGWEESASE
jgi:predicted regulator of Ras-like GTPase activity (Roadblock/LC7/MglB family)